MPSSLSIARRPARPGEDIAVTAIVEVVLRQRPLIRSFACLRTILGILEGIGGDVCGYICSRIRRSGRSRCDTKSIELSLLCGIVEVT